MYYGHTLSLGRNFMGSRGDADAAAYVAAVVAAGGTVSGAQATAINDFYVSAKADSYYTSLKRLYLPIWGVAAANAIDMIGLTSGTFVGGVTHAAGYVRGDGTTGYFDWGVSPRTMGMTESLGSLFALIKTTRVASTTLEYASTLNGGTNRLFSNSSTLLGDMGNGSSLSLTSANQIGILYAVRTSNSSLISKQLRTSGTLAGTEQTTVNTANSATGNLFSMAVNVPGASNQSDHESGAYGAALFATVGTADTAMAHLKTLWEGTTGLTMG